MARAALKIGVRDIATLAKVSPATVTRVESDAPANQSTLLALQSAYEAKGVQFLGNSWVSVPLGGPGTMPKDDEMRILRELCGDDADLKRAIRRYRGLAHLRSEDAEEIISEKID
ncbi:hypothetical protein [Gluconacetobacter aggeris]|uniref:hypothetical protein n=1 Tax=Gluconacetobacter aggeris TaxID=1286186 RepID=UPI001C7E244A|nr:hypothetical protein [Gluconacetobacter aggeris]